MTKLGSIEQEKRASAGARSRPGFGSVPIALPTDAVSPVPTALLAAGRRDYRMRRLLVAADTIAMLVAIGTWLAVGVHKPFQHALWALPTIPVWLALFLMYGLVLHRAAPGRARDRGRHSGTGARLPGRWGGQLDLLPRDAGRTSWPSSTCSLFMGVGFVVALSASLDPRGPGRWPCSARSGSCSSAAGR